MEARFCLNILDNFEAEVSARFRLKFLTIVIVGIYSDYSSSDSVEFQ